MTHCSTLSMIKIAVKYMPLISCLLVEGLPEWLQALLGQHPPHRSSDLHLLLLSGQFYLVLFLSGLKPPPHLTELSQQTLKQRKQKQINCSHTSTSLHLDTIGSGRAACHIKEVFKWFKSNLVCLGPSEWFMIIISIYVTRYIHCKFIWMGNVMTVFNIFLVQIKLQNPHKSFTNKQ